MALADQIAQLESILDAGASRVTTDGVTVQYDLEEIRRRLAKLQNELDQTKRPRLASIDLSGGV